MGSWPWSEKRNLNSINLGDDLDDVEFVAEVEKVSGVQFSNDETIKRITMADLEGLVRTKLETSLDFDPAWTIRCSIARELTGQKGPIDRETTFFAKFGKEMTWPT